MNRATSLRPRAHAESLTRALLITAGELSYDPRARRAAEGAAELGLEVAGLCLSDEGDLPGVPVIRIPALRCEQRLRSSWLSSAGYSPMRELRGLYRLARHAWTTYRFVRAARTLERCSIVHANDFDTLPAGAYLARRWHSRLVYDSHELYTMQEPDPPRIYCALVRRMESALARRSDTVITVSPAYADALVDHLRLERRPVIVMNCPPVTALNAGSARDAGTVRVVYQAAMGPGRRVEDIVDAAPYAEGAHITLRVLGADPDALRALTASRQLAGRVEIGAPVPADRLVESLAGFDIGLIINRPVTRTDELVLPNKLFEYMMAGLAVVAPDLPVIGALVERDRIGLTYPPGDSAAMGRAIRRLGEDADLLQRCRERARALALETYNAEAQIAELARAWGIDPPGR